MGHRVYGLGAPSQDGLWAIGFRAYILRMLAPSRVGLRAVGFRV